MCFDDRYISLTEDKQHINIKTWNHELNWKQGTDRMSIKIGENKNKQEILTYFIECCSDIVLSILFVFFHTVQLVWKIGILNKHRILFIWLIDLFYSKGKYKKGRKDGRDRIEGERKCPHGVPMTVWTSRRFSSSCGRLDQARIQLPVMVESPLPQQLKKEHEGQRSHIRRYYTA